MKVIEAMRRWEGLAAVAAFSLATGLGLGAAKWRGNAEYWHREARMAALIAHAPQTPPGAVLVVGDSVTEQIHFTTLCGRPAINAGIARSTSQLWLEDAPRLVAAYRPSIIVLALGTNDSGDWASEFQQLSQLADYAVEPSDPRKAAIVRAAIRTVPGISHTTDGKHPTVQGARQWLANVESGCPN